MGNIKKLAQILVDLDKREREIDKLVKDLRLETHNLFWEILELRKMKEKDSGPKME